MSIPHWQERTALLLKSANILKLKNSHVLVVGLGGVGGYAAEQICRAGVGKMTIIDGDLINVTNRNRQLIALSSTEGLPKTDAMAKRLLDINPELNLVVIQEFIKDERLLEILKADHYDYVIDAIDTLTPKLFLISHCKNLNLRIVSSMGAGGKMDPTKIEITDLSKSYNCRLAYFIRKHLRKFGINSGFKVVFSPELVSDEAVIETEGEQNKKSIVGTISYMPAAFGIACASVVIRELINNEK